MDKRQRRRQALLLYGLQTFETKYPAQMTTTIRKLRLPNNLLDKKWDLYSYAQAARDLALISQTTLLEIMPAREYRNLIHPAKSVREKVHFDRGTALVGAGAVEHVILDLKKNL